MEGKNWSGSVWFVLILRYWSRPLLFSLVSAISAIFGATIEMTLPSQKFIKKMHWKLLLVVSLRVEILSVAPERFRNFRYCVWVSIQFPYLSMRGAFFILGIL